jgi:hypothetical protein
MSKLNINIGSKANDKAGDTLRTAFDKINLNFTELYTLTGGASTALTELAQDYAAPLFNHASHVNITVTYDDANNKILLTGVASAVWPVTNTAGASGPTKVAIGANAGLTTQGPYAVAIGTGAGNATQGDSAVAVGIDAGKTTQGANAVAVGIESGRGQQGTGSVAVGYQAAFLAQGTNAVAVGKNAGSDSQGTNAVAVGNSAGRANQPANTIILNASGSTVNGVASQTNSFYVSPIRSATATSDVLYYNTTTKEITYAAAGSVSSLVNSTKTVSLASTGVLSLPAQGLLTNVNQITSAIINRTGASTDTAAIQDAWETWYGNELMYRTYLDQEVQPGFPPRPWFNKPSWEGYPLIMEYNSAGGGGGGQLPPNPNLAPVAKTAVDSYLAYKELVSNIDIVSGNKAFSFENTGELSLPATLVFKDAANAKIVLKTTDNYGYVLEPSEFDKAWTFNANGVLALPGNLTFPDGTEYTGQDIRPPVDGGLGIALNRNLELSAVAAVNSGQGQLYIDTSTNNDTSEVDIFWKLNTGTFGVPVLTPITSVITPTPGVRRISVTGVTFVVGQTYTFRRDLIDSVSWLFQSDGALRTSGYGTISHYPGLTSSLKLEVPGSNKIALRTAGGEWQFGSTGNLTLPNSAVIGRASDIEITTAETNYTNSLTTWASERASYQAQATSLGYTSTGWPFIAWNATGTTAAGFISQLTTAWLIQQGAPTSPPTPLIFNPPISTTTYNELRTALVSVRDSYANWQALLTSVEITSGSESITLLANGKLQVPNIIQTDPEEDLVIRTRYAVVTSPPGSGTYTNRDFVFGTNGNLTAPGNLQVNGGKLILNSGGNAYVESVDYGVNSANSAVNIFGGPYQKIKLRAGFGTEATWTYGTNGSLSLPSNGSIASGLNTAQVGSLKRISFTDGGQGNYMAYGATVLSVGYADNVDILTTFAAGSTITFVDGRVRTITAITAGVANAYINIAWTGAIADYLTVPAFPITLKTANFAAATTAPSWRFGNTAALTLPNNAFIKPSENTDISTALTAYNTAVTAWETTRKNEFVYAVLNDLPGLMSFAGWPFATWDNVDGTNAAAYLAIVNNAYTIQNNPSSPPTPLVFTPALTSGRYTQLQSLLTSIINTYAAWQALLTSVDIWAGNEKLSLLSNNKIQVPGIIQTDVEEDLIIRARYVGVTSPPAGSGQLSYANKDFIFGTNGFLTFPDNTVQTTAYVSNITNTVGSSNALLIGSAMVRDDLQVRIVYTAPNSLNVEFRIFGQGVQHTISANNGTNIFAGTSTGLGTWTRFNPAVFTNSGEKAEVVVCDHSYHKIYRVTAMMRDVPTGDNGSGSVYCTIEELK